MTVLRRLIDPTDLTPRLSRPCADKAHRCPGWAGGGMHYARQTRCANGNIRVRPLTRREKERHERDQRLLAEHEASPQGPLDPAFFDEGYFNDYPGAHPLRFGHCNRCGVITLPVAIRYVDPTTLASAARYRVRRLGWAIENYKRERSSR